MDGESEEEITSRGGEASGDIGQGESGVRDEPTKDRHEGRKWGGMQERPKGKSLW